MGDLLPIDEIDEDWSFYITGTGYQEYLAEYETLEKQRYGITQRMNDLKMKMQANKFLRENAWNTRANQDEARDE